MINSASGLPFTSSKLHPNMFSACRFQSVTRPSESMPIKASCAVSTMKRVRISLARNFSSACLRSVTFSKATPMQRSGSGKGRRYIHQELANQITCGDSLHSADFDDRRIGRQDSESSHIFDILQMQHK